MGEQNETGLERELSEDIGPTILWGLRGLGYDPKLALRMVNNGHSMASGGADWPASAHEINLMIGVDATCDVQGQMEIQQAGVRTRMEYGALFFLGFGAGVVRGQVGGATDGAILACQFAGQQFLCGGVGGDFLVGQKRDDAILEGAKAAFDFSFGLGAGGDQMGDAQGGESALEL